MTIRPFRIHKVPRFRGSKSDGHVGVRIWRLFLKARKMHSTFTPRLESGVGFAQFVGFPRSGHSLIGSILDAHPNAIISHELDATGLLDAGLGRESIHALIADNSAAFSDNERYWNGFSYAVPGSKKSGGESIRLIGDKKGDWVARRIGADRSLIEKTYRRFGERCKWILVTRHPMDNIATMSLRKGRVYDKLRIEAESSSAFKLAMKREQDAGNIASEVLDSMIDDYESLCDSIEGMKEQIPSADWHEIIYEKFSSMPEQEIETMLRFSALDLDADFIRSAASIVHRSANKSRTQLSWRDDQIARIDKMISRYSFLKCYEEV